MSTCLPPPPYPGIQPHPVRQSNGAALAYGSAFASAGATLVLNPLAAEGARLAFRKVGGKTPGGCLARANEYMEEGNKLLEVHRLHIPDELYEHLVATFIEICDEGLKIADKPQATGLLNKLKRMLDADEASQHKAKAKKIYGEIVRASRWAANSKLADFEGRRLELADAAKKREEDKIRYGGLLNERNHVQFSGPNPSGTNQASGSSFQPEIERPPCGTAPANTDLKTSKYEHIPLEQIPQSAVGRTTGSSSHGDTSTHGDTSSPSDTSSHGDSSTHDETSALVPRSAIHADSGSAEGSTHSSADGCDAPLPSVKPKP
ncbi:hypothetical protein FA95DRAFT_1567007 [Auriscalpium vulgare]|uniref:Uncharacterized protein n=1 Tax=Auriscalpium vulgare TaxID=40419 RepID=A0ACB8R7Y8_9AGAM|nr:hypothetical protein FA95DRAFT_1567007 [Auriscalpium vulgare]